MSIIVLSGGRLSSDESDKSDGSDGHRCAR